MTEPIWIGREVVGGEPSRELPETGHAHEWRLEDIWATSRPHDLAPSPDGSTVAFVLDRDGTYDVWSIDREGRVARITTNRSPVAYWDDTAPVFSPEGSNLAYANDGWVHVVALESGSDQKVVRGSPGAWLDERRMVVIVDVDMRSRLAVVDLEDPIPNELGPEEGQVADPIVAADGSVIATYYPGSDMNRSDIVRVMPDGTWSTIVGSPDRRAHSARAHRQELVYVNEPGERAGLYLTTLDSGEHRLLAEGDFDLGSPAWSMDGTHIVATASNRGRADLVRVDLDGTITVIDRGGVWSEPVPVKGGVVATHESWSTYPSMVLIGQDEESRTLFDEAPAAISSAVPAGVERVTYQSIDGMEIEGFLSRPGTDNPPAPVILYAHGGPTDRYGEEWDGHAQHFIERGYGWMGINFRGSTTYGLEFERANHGQLGVRDTEDCIAAGLYLAGLEWVDPRRMVIFGASYGAYLTVATLGRPDNPFACGVAKYGDYNMFTSWEQTDVVGHDEFLRLLGHPDDNGEAYRAASPIFTVPQIAVPLLFVHGEKDPRTHYKQAEELLEALQLDGKQFEFVSYPTEAHGLLHREPQLDFYRRMGRFIDWHTAPED